MSNNFTAENACKNVIASLKKSNLHFMLKETPFSAQVIIRKKLIKPLEWKKTIQNVQNRKSNTKKEKENVLLPKVSLLENELLILKNSFANLKLKHNNQENQLVDGQTQLEKIMKENFELKRKLEKSQSVKINVSQKYETEKKKLYDKCDIVYILEQSIVNRDLEIANLKVNILNNVEESSSLSFLKINVKTRKDKLMLSGCLSQQIFEDCNKDFSNSEHLRTHICQIELKNPVFRKLEINNVIFPKRSVKIATKILQTVKI